MVIRMLTWRASTALLVVGFVVFSVLADSGATKRVVTGTVAEYKVGESISVTNEATVPEWLPNRLAGNHGL